MRLRPSLVLVLVGLAGTLVPSPALAGSKGGGGAAVPFTQADCGDDVDVSVRLTEDVDCSGVATDAIRIDADGISVDLAGHRLIAAYGYSAVVTDYHSGIVVTGGTIEVSGQGIGVYAYYGTNIRVSALTVVGSGASEGRGVFCYTSTSMTVTGLVASQLGSGIESEYCTIALASSTLSDNRYGYYSFYDSQVSVTGLTVRRNERGVFDDGTARLSISRSLAEENDFGFYLHPDGSGIVTVTGCTARRSSYTADYDPEIGAYDGIGFVLSDAYNHFGGRSTVSSSIASENEHYGFYLYHPGPTVFKGNSALSNGDDGVYVYEAYGSYGPVWGSNDIARDNSGYGLYSDYAVIGTGNRISGNDEDDWGCPGWTCTVSR